MQYSPFSDNSVSSPFTNYEDMVNSRGNPLNTVSFNEIKKKLFNKNEILSKNDNIEIFDFSKKYSIDLANELIIN